MKIENALPIAEKFKNILSPHCIECEIGGSIRRQKPIVKDIEIICVPKATTFTNRRTLEFQQAVYNLGEIVEGLKTRNLGNAKYLKINIDGIRLDLFIVEPENFGLQYLIRTGPDTYSKHILYKFNQKGYTCQGGYPISKRSIVKHRQGLFGDYETPEVAESRLEFTTEQEVYDFLEIPFVEPQNRI